MKVIKFKQFSLANYLPLVVFAGPCQVESTDHALFMCRKIDDICGKLGINYIYKSSFDKANRSSIGGKRGIGFEEGLAALAAVKNEFGCPILTDIHEKEQCKTVAEVADILQVPAFLCRQTDLLLAAGKTGKIVKVKKGQFLAPWDVVNIASKIKSTGNDNIIFTERGTSFGYNTLINDMRGLKIMGDTGYPVVFDATHSIQQPGGLGTASGGQREMIRTVARAAVAVGVAGVFIETHEAPDTAPSDGPCMLPVQHFEKLLAELQQFDQIAKNNLISSDYV